jgi:parallel beta-helix repeat protein
MDDNRRATTTCDRVTTGDSASLPSSKNAWFGRFRPVSEADADGPCTHARVIDLTTGEKLFLKTSEDDARVRAEAAVLSLLDHRSIVRLKDWHAEPGAAWLGLEPIDGIDLEAFIAARGGRLDRQGLVAIMVALAEGVAAIHAQGYLHRDLKPANIMILADETPVIVDFGAALPIDAPGNGSRVSLLTDGYAAPEQYFTDWPEGPWTDIYALGAIALRALTGAPPPPALTRIAATRDKEAERWQWSGDPLKGIIEWAMAVAPAARPRDALLWARRLASAASGRTGDQNALVIGTRTGDPYPPTVAVERKSARTAMAAAQTASPPRDLPTAAKRPVASRALATAGLLLMLAAGIGAVLHFTGRPEKTRWLVDAGGGGDTTTVAEAIRRARDGSMIVIAPGTYPESLALDRPLELSAANTDAPPVIAPVRGPCLVATGKGGSVNGLSLKAPAVTEAGEPIGCVVITGGSFRLHGNRIASLSGPAVVIGGGSQVDIADNTIAEGSGAGIVMGAGARGSIIGNKISDLPEYGLIVRGGASAIVRANTIERSGGMVIAEGARGDFADNTIAASHASAIQVTSGADPEVTGNRVKDAGETGLFVYDGGRGRFQDNTIEGSTLSGIVVSSGGAPRLVGNRVKGSKQHGILVVDHGGGEIDDNAVEDNGGHGIVVSADSGARVGNNRLAGNERPQLLDARKPSAP